MPRPEATEVCAAVRGLREFDRVSVQSAIRGFVTTILQFDCVPTVFEFALGVPSWFVMIRSDSCIPVSWLSGFVSQLPGFFSGISGFGFPSNSFSLMFPFLLALFLKLGDNDCLALIQC